MLAGLQIVSYMVFTASLAAAQPTSFDQIRDEFDSTEGLFLRVANLSAMGFEHPTSATVWRYDLPLALYSLQGLVPPDTVGVIIKRGEIQTQCAYPVNAQTMGRKTGEERDSCGVYPGLENTSGSCAQYTSAESFVSAYFNKPQMTFHSFPDVWRSDTTWVLEAGVCHFTNVSVMLEAQKMLLNRSAVAPTGVTPEEWFSNATKVGSGLTAFNEVIIAPTDESVASSIFWAHSGPFREPLPSDTGACQIAAVLRADATMLPIVELAGVNLDRPFQGCGNDHGPFSTATPGCLSQGIAEWNANLTVGRGKQDASSVFRAVNGATFLELNCPEPWTPGSLDLVI